MSDEVCPWCEHNPYGCSEDKNCDFKSLPMEEEEIVQRVQQEVERIHEAKELVAGSESDIQPERLFGEIIDRTKGIQIMVDRLKQEFGLSDEEIKERCGFDQASTSFITKTKLAAKMAKMKFKRKKK